MFNSFGQMAIFALLAAGALPVAWLLLQVLAARWPARTAIADALGPAPATAVVVPAHDEAAGIARTVQSLRRQLPPGGRLLVVADNCSDETAAIARAAGAEVLERLDPSHRGKGYALDAGVRHLRDAPPDVVVFVDADCVLDDGALQRLAGRAAAEGWPVQGLYRMHPPTSARARHRIAAFAWLLANQVRALGQSRLGGPCLLTGSGLAVPWPALQRVDLANGHLVEDKKLGVDLHLAGLTPVFEPLARIDSTFPVTAAASGQQRARWQQGQADLVREAVPALIAHAWRAKNGRSLMLALDLLVPPLSLLVMATAAVVVPSLVLGMVLGWAAVIGLAVAMLAAVTLAGSLAWWRFGRDVVSLGDLLRAPAYVLRAVPIHIAYVLGRRIRWNRTSRSDGTPD